MEEFFVSFCLVFADRTVYTYCSWNLSFLARKIVEMVVGHFSVICALVCAYLAAASIVINSHKSTNKKTATKNISTENKLDNKQQHHNQPRFKVAERPTLEYVESITNPNQSFPVYKSTVLRDVDDDNGDEVYDDNEKEWMEYKDDGDDYDEDGNKYENAAKQNHSMNGKATNNLEQNKKKPKHHKMETLHVQAHPQMSHHGHYRNDGMVGSTKDKSTPLPRAHVIDSSPKVAPSRIHTPLPAIYRTYSWSRPISLSCKPNFSQFVYTNNNPYKYYYHYCNECYSICNFAYY